MIRHIWSVLCRSSVIDKDSNSLSLFEIVEGLTVLQEVPDNASIPIPLELVTLWARQDPDQPAKAKARARLLLPGGEQIGKTAEYQIDLTKFKRLRHRFKTGTFPVRSAGIYEFIVDISGDTSTWHEVTRIPIEISFKLPATQGEGKPQ